MQLSNVIAVIGYDEMQNGIEIESDAQIITENEGIELTNNIIDNKDAETTIVDEVTIDPEVKQSETINMDKTNISNEQMNVTMLEKNEKQDVSVNTNQKLDENSGIDMSININKSMPAGKTQSSESMSGFGNTSSQLKEETAVYNGSNNNYLASLEIEGESLNTIFNKENTTYFVKTSDKTQLNVNVVAESSDAKVYITGNDNLKNGDNKVLISVIAENGDVRYYRVFVTNN